MSHTLKLARAKGITTDTCDRAAKNILRNRHIQQTWQPDQQLAVGGDHLFVFWKKNLLKKRAWTPLPLWKIPIYQKFAPLENFHLPKNCPFGKFPSTKNLSLWKIPIYQKFAPLENSHLPKICPFGKFPSTKNLPLGKFPSTKKCRSYLSPFI